MIAVAEVEAASRWYQHVLGAASGHGGAEYEQLLVDGRLIMQLHRLEVGHHHGTIGDPAQPVGNGVALWFETSDFEATVQRIRAIGPLIVNDVHVNPQRGPPRDLDSRPRRLPGRLRGAVQLAIGSSVTRQRLGKVRRSAA